MAETGQRRTSLRMDRPSWVDSFISCRLEWKLYDSQTDRIKFCHAESQKEAISKALAWNIVPRSTNDVAPRQGDGSIDIMSETEFQEFMSSLRREG